MNELPSGHILSIVIPAYNEERAIAGTITRCLEARSEIVRSANLQTVDIVVVNDGSTDRTREIAQTFEGVKVITFEQNKGYGAALKEGFAQSTSSLVGFLDADGTCDPRYFASMCCAAVQDGADVVLGSRMGPDSKMPRVRRLGNKVFAALLGFLSGQYITDTASGMRVIRREALSRLYPLPDRMHFTPAMSARAVFNGLRLVEIPMCYADRVGQSKLRAIRDGVCFLKAIISAMMCYRPDQFFTLGLLSCMVLTIVLAAYPVEHYCRHGRIEDWMIYRFMACFLLGSYAQFSLSATAILHRIGCLVPRRNEKRFWPEVAVSFFEGKWLLATTAVVVTVTLLALWPGIVELLSTGRVTFHWSRLLVGAFGLLLVANTIATSLVLQVVALWKLEDQERIRSTAKTFVNERQCIPFKESPESRVA